MDISGSPVPAERPVELRRSRRRLLGSGYLSGGLAVGALSLLAGFIALPILSLVIWTVSNSAWQEMTSPAAVDALLLSARTTAISMTIILLVGTPAAYVLARYDFPGKRAVNTLVDLPAVLPPSGGWASSGSSSQPSASPLASPRRRSSWQSYSSQRTSTLGRRR